MRAIVFSVCVGLCGVTTGCFFAEGADEPANSPPVVCEGVYEGDVVWGWDLKTLEGYVTIEGDLTIDYYGTNNLSYVECLASVEGDFALTSFYNLEDMTGLDNLESVDGIFALENNRFLESLDGLGSLKTIGEELTIVNNEALPDCEVCDLLAQLESGPTSVTVSGNLEDSCSPVPGNCP